MNDEDIVQLYWDRDESALRETELKYQNYLMKIAVNILYDKEDSREAVNDTYLKAWNAMPPHKPNALAVFLGRITRQLSIDRWRTKTREKRGGSEYALSLDELEDCVSGGAPEDSFEVKRLSQAIGAYLRTLNDSKRNVFVWRYYFCESIKEISERSGESESKIKSMLYRTREGLKQYLEKEGYSV
ncbi:MAG: RNA polymerase sigma factor [Oscillospiraceae bacterium]